MKELFEELVQIIKQATPAGVTPVDMLISIIPMSKEAAYRRLRHEISFTFEEVVKIAKELGVSLDGMIDLPQKNRYNVQMTCVGGEDLIELYRNSFEEIIAGLKKLKTCSNPAIYLFTNKLFPFSHTFKYDMIAKFRLYKWTYLRDEVIIPTKMHEINVPSDIMRVENELFREMMNIPLNYICIPELMQIYVRDIKQCQKINLITDEEVLRLKNETFGLLDDLERDATNGVNQNNVPFNMFLCNSNFDASYLCFAGDEYKVVSTQLFGAGFYFFKDARIIDRMTNWINILIKNSTLVSISGEKQRLEFFRNQRMIVDAL